MNLSVETRQELKHQQECLANERDTNHKECLRLGTEVDAIQYILDLAETNAAPPPPEIPF